MVSLGKPEMPIVSASEDSLGRDLFVRRLVASLISKESQMSTGVVIGLTGAWGSGKSSALNLVEERIDKDFPNALVVRFDPWLVSGRNDLVAAFIGELLAQLKAKSDVHEALDSVIKTLDEYASHLSPFADLLLPGAGSITVGSLRIFRKATLSDQSLPALREKLVEQLKTAQVPIVILIDEVDRVEDAEIRAIAQLVRAIADFPGMSYLLAYDPDRVAQALASGTTIEGDSLERGRAYLEKIVQLQIPLPAIGDDEVRDLLIHELEDLSSELRLPKNFTAGERFQNLLNVTAGSIVATPRDVGRLIGTYHALAGMLLGEVDWIDLLGYCVLLTKSPAVIAAVRENPGLFIGEHLSHRDFVRESGVEKMSVGKRFEIALGGETVTDDTRALIEYLFPKFSEFAVHGEIHTDAISLRRPLLTTLRLGRLPGQFLRSDIEKLVSSEPDEIVTQLGAAYEADTLQQLIDRFRELYWTMPNVDHIRLWRGIANFLKKPDCEWMSSYQPIRVAIREFAQILERVVERDSAAFQPIAIQVFEKLYQSGENVLTATWLRTHVREFGLFGWRRETPSSRSFLSEKQAESTARNMSTHLRRVHLEGNLLPCRWDLQPVYTMIDMGQWDESCREEVNRVLQDGRAIDGISLMLFGGYFSEERETVNKFCSLDVYLSAVEDRLSSADTLHDSVISAHQNALAGTPFDGSDKGSGPNS